jgi:hypothetical protein
MVFAHTGSLDVSIFVKGSYHRAIEAEELIREGEVSQSITSWNSKINRKNAFEKKEGFTKRRKSKIHLTPSLE